MATSAPKFVLAHVTESRMRAPLDDAVMRGFVSAFDAVNRLARASEGFRWQLESRQPGHPVVRPDDPLHVVNVSTWVDYASLHTFVYRSAHGRTLLRRRDWFEAVPQPSTALWWVPGETVPSLEDAITRLAYLRRYGATPRAFTLRQRYGPDGRVEGSMMRSRRRAR